MNTLKLIAFSSNNKEPQKIVLLNESGEEVAKVYCDQEITFNKPILMGSNNWYAINAVAENFYLFYENIEHRS